MDEICDYPQPKRFELLQQNLLHWLLIICIYFPQPLQLLSSTFTASATAATAFTEYHKHFVTSFLPKSREDLRVTGIASPPSTIQIYDWNRNLEAKTYNLTTGVRSLQLKWLIHPVRDAAEPRDRTDCKNGLIWTAEELMFTPVQTFSCKCLCVCTGERNLTSNEVSIWNFLVAGNC